MRDTLLDEISLANAPDRQVLGRATTPLLLSGETRTLRISDLLRQLSQQRPMAIILPASSGEMPLHRVVCDVCSNEGIAVVLLPD